MPLGTFDDPQHYDVELAWSAISPGRRVRWLTPSFHKVGTLVSIKGRAMRVRFDHELRDTVIPDARWYFVQRRCGDTANQLSVVNDKVRAKATRPADGRPAYAKPHEDMVDLVTACADAGVHPKDVRRWLRSGKVHGTQREGRWYVEESSLSKYMSEKPVKLHG